MKATSIVGALIAVAVPYTATGCFSVIGVRGPPAPCTDGYVLPVLDTLVVPAGAVFAARTIALKHSDPYFDDSLYSQTVAFGVIVALAAGVSAAVGYYKVNACRKSMRPLVDEPTHPTSPPENDRDTTWTLFEQAVVAAHNGDCRTVTKLGPQILLLDSEFHRTILMRNFAIQRCLEPSVPIAPINAAPAPLEPPVRR